MDYVKVLAPAKLNLTLDIVGTQANGYHLMDMIMQSVSLYEEVKLEKSDDITLKLSDASLPVNERNTAYKAAATFFCDTGLLAGVKINIKKAVPVRAGMAGGSADAAAVIVGLNALYGAKLTLQQMCEIGAKIGADVPFCIVGGTAHVSGIGDVIKPISNCPACFFTVVMPSGGVSTPYAFAKYDEIGTDKRPDNTGAIQAINSGNLSALCGSMHNSLQYSSESWHNDIICNILKDSGAMAALMTGSGAAVFGVFETQKQAEKARDNCLKQYADCWVLEPVQRGAHVL